MGTQYLYGIDLSRYQPGPNDFRRTRANGYEFAVQRWGIGSTYRDSTRVRHVSDIIASGMVPGVYLVLSAQEDPRTQAHTFVNEVWQHFGHNQPMLYVLDAEISKSFGSPSAQACYTFAATLTTKIGRPAICYIPKWYMQDRRWSQDDINRMREFYWWQSRYPIDPDLDAVPPPFGSWPVTFWQYTSSASVPGIPGDCDANVFYGDLDTLWTLAGIHVTPPLHLELENDMFTFGTPGKPVIFVCGGRGAGLNQRTDLETIQRAAAEAKAPLPHFDLDAGTYNEFLEVYRT